MCLQSFAKNAGLYGERIGALHVVAPSKEAATRVKSQLSVLARSEISNPPAHGARLVSTRVSSTDDRLIDPVLSAPCLCIFIRVPCTQVSLILNDAVLFEEWKRDIRTMAGRIIQMRHELHKLLTEELKTPGNWDHIINQIGMFRCVRFALCCGTLVSVIGSAQTAGVLEVRACGSP